ncbi:hypothetical protein [Phenylobacterium sp.]|uniref:tetratricopeptide repeat protein n=1 Tax=Phenylobacterium sp. TaxID=1871053 RepID=UPI0025F93223|nr:hypothetical protein [Phenylobacterium sp.]
MSGDADAQYRLGLSYCCLTGAESSTQMATEWLCRAARQGHPAAQYELGRIYAGENPRSPSRGRKLMRTVAANQDLSQAQAWFALAGANGHAEAAARADDLAARMSVTERAAAEALRADWRRIPCAYDEVFSQDA